MSAEQAEIYTLLRDEDGSEGFTYEEFKKWLTSGENFQLIHDSSKFYVVHKAVEMFKQYDVDGQGSLDVEEFSKVLTDLNYNASTTEAAVKALDKDGNGVISFSEFLDWLHWV
jgi:Ca2+-binding EF-hand superfamily protein